MTWPDLLLWFFGAAGPGAAFAGWLRGYLERRRSREFFGAIRADRQISEAMRALLDVAGAQRVLLFKSENGGGIPKPGNPEIKATVMKEAVHGARRTATVWQRRKVDEQYLQLLGDLHQHRRVRLVATDMPECELRDYYSASGINHAELVAVCFLTTPCAFIYLSIHFAEESEMTPAARDAVNGTVSLVSRLLSKHNRLVSYQPTDAD